MSHHRACFVRLRGSGSQHYRVSTVLGAHCRPTATPAGATWVEIEDAGDGRVMMTVNAISPSQTLDDDDRGVVMGEAAEAWFRAVGRT